MQDIDFTKNFDRALICFKEKGKTIEGVFDLLLRGGGGYQDHVYIENWSDLDLSIIVYDVNETVLSQYRWLYDEVKKVFPYKLSLALVTYQDFISPFHHHGMKPIYYNALLKNSISLLRETSQLREDINLKIQQFDCMANVAYLIYDLKSRWLTLDLEKEEALRECLCHAAKRAKHIIRNSIFIITGDISEEIPAEVFRKLFPKEDENFPQKLKKYKLEFANYISCDKKQIQKEILLILTTVERIYKMLMDVYLPQKNF